MKQLLFACLTTLVMALPASAQVITPNQSITVVDSGTACVTAPAACATWALDNQTGGVTFSIFGTWTGTLTFEGTNNDGIWTAVPATNVATDARATTTTASGLYTIPNLGLIKVRLRATAAITGAAQITAAKGWGFTRLWSTGGTITAGGAGGSFYAADGTALLPAYSFTSEPTLGFWRSASGALNVQAPNFNVLSGNLNVGTGGVRDGINGGNLKPVGNGLWVINNAANTTGVEFKADALPTIASGFGTSPGVIAGSTPLAGRVDVGTGGVATSGVINFGGTAFPSTPFCVVSSSVTNGIQRVSGASTTQLAITSSVAWTASDLISWICISSK